MNFRRILSKSSLKSSTSSGKSVNQIDEIKKLHDDSESLKLNISSLKVLLESRDAAIGTLAREKEKLYVDLKTLQRTNKNLQQRSIDEREMYAKEKEFLVNNVKRLSGKLANNSKSNEILREEEYILMLKNEIKSKDEVIYNICSKYFKLKKSKEGLQNKFVSLQRYTQEVFETIINSLEDNKNFLDFLLDELRKSEKITPSHKKYIELLKINADLSFENTQLKLCLIPKGKFDANGVKEEMEASVIFVPGCSQSAKLYDIYKSETRRKSIYSIDQLFRRSKSSVSNVVGFFNKLMSIKKYNRSIRYRSMSDTMLPKNFYK